MAHDQPWSSYDQATVLNKRVVPDAISLIDPVEIQAINALGGLDGARSKFNIKMNGRQVEWLVDQYRQFTATLSATAASDATQLTVSDATPLKIGDVIRLPTGGQKSNITGIDYTNNTINVVTLASASTQATGTITIESVARIEGAEADYGPIEVVTSAYNVVQEFEDAKKVTDIEQVIEQYGITDPLDYQRRKIIPEQMRFLERAVLQATVRSDGSKTAARVFGGLPYWIATNTFSTGAAALALSDFRAVVLSCYNAGGNVDLMITHPQQLNTLAALYDNTGYLRVEVDEERLGMTPMKIVTPFGSFNAATSRWANTGDIWLLDSRHVGLYTLIPWMEKELPSSGTYKALEISGAFSLLLKHETAHGLITVT